MKLYLELLKAIIRKFILRRSTGEVVRKFCEKLGVVYIKLAQILATQNFDNIFNESDRRILSSICDDVNPISFSIIKSVIESEYGKSLADIFSYIDEKPLGSASISQVHKAILYSGEEVAIKVKRKDITDKIEKDIKRIRFLMHKFGKFISFKNLLGGDKALDMYLSWIYDETNFDNEKNNIKIYREFANSVNGKVKGTKNIVVPKVFDELCTSNILVMEFVRSQTINKRELNFQNMELIREGLNSYFKSSFYAMFNDKKIVFHGDPHGGNIYIDKSGNIGFLDMGLIFELSPEDARLTREFFLSAYTCNYEKLYNMLIGYAKISLEDSVRFKESIKEYTFKVKSKPVTAYFTDMINICFNYNIAPPDFLFCMAKAFVCLDGINGFSFNSTSAVSLLMEQTMEFCVNRSIQDCKDLVIDGIGVVPRILKNSFKDGVIPSISKEIVKLQDVKSDLKKVLEHTDELISLFKVNIDDSVK